ncbi:hypothetical protein AAHA92_05026 [Salvia divinorum]|uniref:Replication protein A 70 kDa DNA-binding subunit B/D first OB fold domain-containing protein n=1 Tax=Salvia divinorum TaxID=28513 RepID=A0ABD1I163_SALDI
MPLFFTLIDNLHPSVISSVIKVCCIRVYDVAMPGNKKEIISLDCVLHDRKGVRIQATFPRNLIDKPNLFRGDVRISTHYNASMVYINSGAVEFKDFEKRICNDQLFFGQKCIVKYSGKKVNNEFNGIVVKSIYDLLCLEIADSSFVTPISSTLTKDVEEELLYESSAKRCLDLDFEGCDGDVLKKNKSGVSLEDLETNNDGTFSSDLEI